MNESSRVRSVEVFDVRIGTCPNHDQALDSLNRSGRAEITAAAITVSGGRKTGGGTGAVMFGAVGALASAGAAAATSRKLQIQIDPKATAAFCDPRHRVVSLKLPDGTWLAITPRQALLRKGQSVFDRFVVALEASTGRSVQRADLGKMGEGRKKLLKVLIAIMIIFAILAVVAFAISSTGVGRR